MFVLLLSACDGEGARDDARERADALLEAHPRGTAIVRVPLGRPGMDAAVGTRWGGADLGEWLAPCALEADLTFDAELSLEPGTFPWTVTDRDGDAPPCVWERLATFPFEEPSGRAEEDLVHVRWRPNDRVPAVRVREGGAERGVPSGLLALAPPYFRSSASGRSLESGEDLVIDGGSVRIRPSRRSDVMAGPLDEPEAWARQLTCAAEGRGLVRTTLVFWDGSLERTDTAPENECVEERVKDARKWMREQWIGGERLGDLGRVLVVLDVPVGSW